MKRYRVNGHKVVHAGGPFMTNCGKHIRPDDPLVLDAPVDCKACLATWNYKIDAGLVNPRAHREAKA